jgi:hypothetical protein
MESDDINGVKHFVFADEAEFRKYHFTEPIVTDWRNAAKGDWVRADDGGIVQILRASGSTGIKHPVRMLGTIVGTFPTSRWNTMDTNFTLHPNRYVVSSLTDKERRERKKGKPLSAKDMLIVHHMLTGMMPEEAIRIVHNRKAKLSPYTVRGKLEELYRDRRVIVLIKEAVEKAARDLNIGPRTIVERLNQLSLNADKDATRLAATQTLADLMDLKPEHDRGRPMFPGAGKGDGQIADAEFKLIGSVVGKGQRESEGKGITNGYKE